MKYAVMEDLKSNVRGPKVLLEISVSELNTIHDCLETIIEKGGKASLLKKVNAVLAELSEINF